jgi:methylated-DNA-[protein]-cysteine S-methyltransferase
MNKNFYLHFTTVFGQMMGELSTEGEILGLWFLKQEYFPELEETAFIVKEEELKDILKNKEYSAQDIPEKVAKSMKELVLQLNEYAMGKRKSFDLNLKPKGTEFRERVWKILEEIPYGKTITYGDIAKRLCKEMGKESMSAQAVGGAVGHNPIGILIPCHRVIGSDGSLTGYAGGLDKKIALLNIEGIRILN